MPASRLKWSVATQLPACGIWVIDPPWTLAAACGSDSCGYISVPDFPVLWQPGSKELECAHPLEARPTQTPGTSGGKRVGPGSVRLVLSAAATSSYERIAGDQAKITGSCRHLWGKLSVLQRKLSASQRRMGAGQSIGWIFPVA